ncbi:MAG: phosphomannose isomerase type II C-terminal cupin domain [Rickettsiaceae bacterium H1]|nr:phosphomannose isomerase type II C-terminal cupin domain [Rickettsiaceae bacterium H1]
MIGDFVWLDIGNWEALYDMVSNNEKVSVYENIPYGKEVIIQEVIKNKLLLIIAENKIFLIPVFLLYQDVDVIDKNWGKYLVVYYGDKIKIKYLSVFPCQSTSLHRHKHRSENWLIFSGEANVIVNNNTKLGKKGDVFFIPKNCFHKIENVSSTEELHIIELQLGEVLSENDIIRFESNTTG